MKFYINNVSHLCAIGLVSSMLAACGGGSSSNKKTTDDDHHDHGSLLISQASSTTISALDEGSLAAFDNTVAFNGATFVRSDNGEFAAIKGGETIYFAGEDGVLLKTIDGNEVLATNGHFSILQAGSSTLLEVESLEEDTLETSSTAGLGLNENFPALMLDEDEEVKLLFVEGKAIVYEGDSASTAEIACTNPSAAAQAHHAAIVTCDEGVTLLQFEEDESTDTISFEATLLNLDGTDSNYLWSSSEHVFAGYVPGSSDYALVHIEEHEAHSETETEAKEAEYELIQPADEDAHAFTGVICEAGLEAEDNDFIFWLAGGEFVALTNEGELNKTIAVDTSSSNDCADYSLSLAAKVAYVLDNNAMKFYEIDVDEGAAFYHIHETLDISVSDIADSVVLFHNEAGHGDHDH